MKSVTEFNDYKDFLRFTVEENRVNRGYQSRLARAAMCQRSFLSQVIRGPVHLTPDHAAGLCAFWNLSQMETDYFIELTHLARASSPHLRKHIQQRLQQMKKKRLDLAERFEEPRISKSEMEAIYYSSWHWSALHVITSIPKFRALKPIQERLSLPAELVESSLLKLEAMGIVKRDQGHWETQHRSIHLPRESPYNTNHQFSWRQRALIDSQKNNPESVHYTAIHALSKKDVDRIRDMVLEFIEQTRTVVKDSPEEEMACFCCDFFVV